jgi:hypothetical protein
MYNQQQSKQGNQVYATNNLVMANGRPQVAQQGAAQQQQQRQRNNAQNNAQGDSLNQTQIGGVPRNYNVNQWQQQAQQRYGRQATQDELNQVAQRVGYQGGDISQQQWDQSWSVADEMAKKMGWQPPQQQNSQNQWGQNHSTIDPVTGRMFGPQYQNPFQQQQQQLMQQILGSGGSMNQQVQDSMFEQQKEQALALQKQLGMAGSQGVASRGFGPKGGAAAGMQGQLNNALAQQLMGGRRDIATQAAQVNRADQLAALGASQGLDQQGYQQFMGDRNSQLQEWLAQRGNQLDTRRQSAQEEQFRRDLELRYQQFMEGQRQFNENFGENRRQFNNQLGFNYTNMNNTNNQNFLRYLMGA